VNTTTINSNDKLITALEPVSNVAQAHSLLSKLAVANDDIDLLVVPRKKAQPVKEYIASFKKLIFSTQKLLSITTLWLYRDGPQEQLLKAAIKTLNARASAAQPIHVRILYSISKQKQAIFSMASPENYFIDGLTLNPHFHLAFYRFSFLTDGHAFNHAKIVAVDDDKLLVGGINFVHHDYQSLEEPVHDVAVKITRPQVAYMGHNYLSRLVESGKPKYGQIFSGGEAQDYLSAEFSHLFQAAFTLENTLNTTLTANPLDEEGYMLGVGKLQGGTGNENIGKQAMFAMLANAQQQIDVAQQSIGFIPGKHQGKFTDTGDEFCRMIAQALKRGVRVNIILSGRENMGDFINHISQPALTQYIKNVGELTDVQLDLLTIRAAKNRFDRQGSSAGKTRLHAKAIIVDEQMVYLGSQNLYYDNHAEFGVIIHNKAFAQRFKQQFWQGLWPNKPASETEVYQEPLADNLLALSSKLTSAWRLIG
jgi:phosphatidylserine/phosphatidylglycerophosphate/cardiolipin synthase-like enzyme